MDRRLIAGAFVVAAGLLGCGAHHSRPIVVSRVDVPDDVRAAVAATDRTAADRALDAGRHPAETLAFFGIAPGMRVAELGAGGGYTTELLARAVGPSGQAYGQSPARPNATRSSAMALAQRQTALVAAQVPAATLVAVPQPFDNPVPPGLADGGLDLVTLMFNYHDLGAAGVDRAKMNAAIYRALKPGGLYVIADHAGRPGTGISESNTLHRIEESFLKAEVEAAGFRLAEEGSFLRNPNDPRDRETPEPAMPKDEFVLKFRKP